MYSIFKYFKMQCAPQLPEHGSCNAGYKVMVIGRATSSPCGLPQDEIMFVDYHTINFTVHPMHCDLHVLQNAT